MLHADTEAGFRPWVSLTADAEGRLHLVFYLLGQDNPEGVLMYGLREGG